MALTSYPYIYFLSQFLAVINFQFLFGFAATGFTRGCNCLLVHGILHFTNKGVSQQSTRLPSLDSLAVGLKAMPGHALGHIIRIHES